MSEEDISPFVRQRPERTELHLGREYLFGSFSFFQFFSEISFGTDLHYLALSTDLKTVSCHL